MTHFSFQKIYQRYKEHLSSFSESYQVHFANRLYRVTGEQEMLAILSENISKQGSHIFTELEKLGTAAMDLQTLDEPIRGTILRNPVEYKRIQRRQSYYKEHPRLKFYFDVISQLYFLYENQTLPTVDQKKLQQVINLFQKFPWMEEFAKKEHFQIHPVLFVNSIYQLYEMGCLENLEWFDQMVMELYPPSILLHDELLFDQCYVYTHIIINEASFYKRFLSSEQVKKWQWILDFFSRELTHIITRVNIDLLIEIPLCFLLCRQEHQHIQQSIFDELMKYYDETGDYLRKDEQATYQDMEHANALFLMYLKQPTHFYTGEK